MWRVYSLKQSSTENIFFWFINTNIKRLKTNKYRKTLVAVKLDELNEKNIFKAPTKATSWDVFAIQWNPSKQSNWLAAAANIEVFVWDVNRETKVIKLHAKEV